MGSFHPGRNPTGFHQKSIDQNSVMTLPTVERHSISLGFSQYGASGENGRRSSVKESRCMPIGRQEEKRKTATEMGGLREQRRRECRSRRKLEGKSTRQKITGGNSSEGG